MFRRKHCTFAVPIEKEVTRIDNSREKNITKNMSFRLQFIDSPKIMASSLLDLFNNLSDRIYKIQCKYRYNDKKCETCGIKYKYCNCFLKYTDFKDSML